MSLHSCLKRECSWPCGYDLHNVNWYMTMFWISSQTGTREPKKLWAFLSLLNRGLVLKPIITTCMATVLTVALLLVILVFVSKPACGYSPILFVIVWVGKIWAEGLNVAIFNIVVSHENNEKLFASLGYQVVCCGFCLKLGVGSLDLVFVVCLVGAPGYPRKGLYKSRAESSSHLWGV